jgi:UDP-glucose 4-epimerase
VTGGAGFIGSHVVDFFIGRSDTVTVLDDLSSGSLDNLEQSRASPRLNMVRGDIKDVALVDSLMPGQDIVFHFCDKSDIRFAADHPRDYIDQNIIGAVNVLESMRKWRVPRIVFPSSTTVLGDATTVPTPEHYGPLKPMNLYGGAKAACEGLLSAYAYTYDLRATVFRFVDVVGDRIDHGVIYDFMRKLTKNPEELEILGDGSQRRSFLLVDDCVSGIWTALSSGDATASLVHLGNSDQIGITRVAELICEVMGLKDVRFKYTGGKRGWKGDSFSNFIANNHLDSLGWRPERASEEAVRETTRRLLAQFARRKQGACGSA